LNRAALTLLSVISFFALGAGSSALADAPGTYTTKQIVKFQQMQGQPQWVSNIQRRIRGATWTFYPGGRFKYSPADSRDDLFPLEGRYTCAAHSCRFQAEASSRTGGTGSASVSIEGTLDVSGREPRLEMYQINSMGNAAVINGTNFSQANGSSYRFTVVLTRR
jgi:hypothetical protein